MNSTYTVYNSKICLLKSTNAGQKKKSRIRDVENVDAEPKRSHNESQAETYYMVQFISLHFKIKIKSTSDH